MLDARVGCTNASWSSRPDAACVSGSHVAILSYCVLFGCKTGCWLSSIAGIGRNKYWNSIDAYSINTKHAKFHASGFITVLT